MEAIQRGTTLLCVPSGDALAFLPHAELKRLMNIRDYACGFVMLENALCRPRNKRRAADFDAWTFVLSLSGEQLLEPRNDVSNALMRAYSGTNTVRSLLDARRATAESIADGTVVIALGEDLESFTEVQHSKDVET